MSRLMPLDGLRGLAVLMVLGSHSSNAGFDLAPGLHMGGLGLPGVFLFFVLSSFLLTGQLFDRADAGKPIGWARFGGRRLLRILPAYALALGVHVLFGVFDARVALQQFAMVRAEGHFWTIPVEVFFYLTLPLIVFLAAPLRTPLARAAVLLVLAAVMRWGFPAELAAISPALESYVPPYLPIFLVGATLASLRPLWQSPVEASPRRRRASLWLGSLAAAVLVALTPAVASAISGTPVAFGRFHLWFDVFAGLWALVIMAALQSGGWIRAAASWAPWRWLGQISYSVYLFHALVLGFFVERSSDLGIPRALVGPAFLAAAVLVGAASYFLVERPFLGALRPSQGGSEPQKQAASIGRVAAGSEQD